MERPTTLWSSTTPDKRLLEYTAGDDRAWDARLLSWDVLGSLGHIEGLRAARLITAADHARMRRGLREVFNATSRGRLQLDHRHEDVH
ncbi:MAG: argininosuccinate lyase, partial [Gemmatimonadota bacterium]|nr:argininosuccinate lyase [Gemmatimonadota bacterium]